MSEEKTVNVLVRDFFGVLALAFTVFGFMALNSFSSTDPSFNKSVTGTEVLNSGGMVGAYLADGLVLIFGTGSFFVPVLGAFFKWDGGIPVDRDSKNNIVDQIIQRFNSSDNFILGVAPEGTRSRVEKWKTGFYHIAYKTNVPVLLLAMDFKNKRIGVVNSIVVTGDIDKDMLFIQNHFKEVKGKIPENYNPIIR